MQVRGHQVLTDEPLDAGGTDAGPTPYELLLGALGACTAMTLRLYADRKRWPLEDVEVTLTHDRVHASDCETCETSEPFLDRIRKRIELRGPLTDGQRERLLVIADRCPVQRTLQRDVLIESIH
jgi:putative redox protein